MLTGMYQVLIESSCTSVLVWGSVDDEAEPQPQPCVNSNPKGLVMPENTPNQP